jgi:hypothetical protein
MHEVLGSISDTEEKKKKSQSPVPIFESGLDIRMRLG